MVYTKGRDCKLGYEYNPDYDYIYPIQCNPTNVKRKIEQSCEIDVDYSSILFPSIRSEKFGSFMCQKFINSMDYFKIPNYDEYVCIRIDIRTTILHCNKFDNDDDVCRINKIFYGTHIDLTIEKHIFSQGNKDARLEDVEEKLIKEVYSQKDLSLLTPEQLEAKCKVLINWDEKRIMTLKEVFEFIWDEQNLQNYQCNIGFWYISSKKDDYEYKPMSVFSEAFYDFNIYYRKFEKKINYVKNMDIDFSNQNIDEILFNVKKCIFEFTCFTLKNAVKINYVELYILAKKFSFYGTIYLKYMLENRLAINIASYFERQGFADYLLNLNEWNPDENEKQQIINKLENCSFLDDFIPIIVADTTNTPQKLKYNSNDFVQECFITCDFQYCCENNRKIYKWKCSVCAEFVRVNTVECLCGKKNFNELHFTCSNDIKKQIINKLNEYMNQSNEEISKEINNFLDKLTSEEVDVDILKNVRDQNFNPEIDNLIDEYVKISRIKKRTHKNTSSLHRYRYNIGCMKRYYVGADYYNIFLCTKCPLIGCNDSEFRFHFCSTCKHFIKVKTLICECGEREFENSYFVCDNKKHIKEHREYTLDAICHDISFHRTEESKLFLDIFCNSDEESFVDMLKLAKLLDDERLNKHLNDIINNSMWLSLDEIPH